MSLPDAMNQLIGIEMTYTFQEALFGAITVSDSLKYITSLDHVMKAIFVGCILIGRPCNVLVAIPENLITACCKWMFVFNGNELTLRYRDVR